MHILVTNAIDGEQFLLNTASLRSIYPARNPDCPAARSLALGHQNEFYFWLTESVRTIDAILHRETPKVDIQALREKLEAALAEQRAAERR